MLSNKNKAHTEKKINMPKEKILQHHWNHSLLQGLN